MRFISGLKKLSKKPLLLIILILFITSWFLVLLGITFLTTLIYVRFVLYFCAILLGFTLVLLIFSIFMPIDEMGIKTIIIAAIITIPVLFIFTFIVEFSIQPGVEVSFLELFYFFCFYMNLFLIALFAYKWCTDNSLKVEDYLYDKKDSRTISRILLFAIFSLISFFIITRTIRAFRVIGIDIAANIFLFIGVIDLILLLFVILRLVLVQKLTAFVPMFFTLSYLYVLYVVVDLWAVFIFGGGGSASYDFISFGIDLIMFIYIIGSIFDRVEYLQDKIKIFRVDTIALFVIIMKLYVKLIEIGQDFGPSINPGYEISQAILILLYFTFFSIVLGIYSIFFHKRK